MSTPLDDAVLNFSPESLLVLNFALAFLMFAVSLFIEPRDFLALRERPRSVVTGLASQWLLLPLLTILLVLVLDPHPGLALGMIMVAACPGGNVSNYFCLLARGNLVLSVCLTAVSTLAASVLTPLLFLGGAAAVFGTLELPGLAVDFAAMLETVLGIIALPLVAGLVFRRFAPRAALLVRKPVRTIAGLVLIGFIVAALLNNTAAFHEYALAIVGLVALHNALALAGGYAAGALARMPESERRTVSIETGIQNSGLALVLIFNFFDGNGPMALVAAGWGLWHLVSGGVLSLLWSRSPSSAVSLVEENA